MFGVRRLLLSRTFTSKSVVVSQLPTPVAHCGPGLYVSGPLSESRFVSTFIDSHHPGVDFSLLARLRGDDVSGDEYACESVLRKRKRKMSKHKMQKRRWKERMQRRDFGR